MLDIIQMLISVVLIYVTLSYVKYMVRKTLASIAFKIPRSTMLCDFEKGVTIGYNRNLRSLRSIANDLNHPKLTAAYMIKWKVSGYRWNVPRIGRPPKWRHRSTGAVQRNSEELHPTNSIRTPRVSTSIRVYCFDEYHS